MVSQLWCYPTATAGDINTHKTWVHQKQTAVAWRGWQVRKYPFSSYALLNGPVLVWHPWTAAAFLPMAWLPQPAWFLPFLLTLTNLLHLYSSRWVSRMDKKHRVMPSAHLGSPLTKPKKQLTQGDGEQMGWAYGWGTGEAVLQRPRFWLKHFSGFSQLMALVNYRAHPSSPGRKQTARETLVLSPEWSSEHSLSSVRLSEIILLQLGRFNRRTSRRVVTG